MVVDVAVLVAGVCGVIVMSTAVLYWAGDRLQAVGLGEGFWLVAACGLGLAGFGAIMQWPVTGLARSVRLRAQMRPEYRRSWSEFLRHQDDADLDAVAVISASLAAAAWDARTATPHRISIAGHLAGNEAETHLFGLDRLALCCRPDGSVPISPAQRLADAERLAELAASLDPGGWSGELPLALVRLAQHRRAEAAPLARRHVADSRGQAWAEQPRAILAVALLDDDPDAARREARTAWDNIDEKQRSAPGAETVARALAYIERHIPTAQV